MDFLAWMGGDGGQRGGRGVPEPVTLHIYDLGPTTAPVNVIFRAVGTGAFHAGVEVFGNEWSFGCGAMGRYGTGVFRCPPRGCDAHVYREFVEMGETKLSRKEVSSLIEELQKKWVGRDYDLLRHNCCHFSNDLCEQLGVGPVPSWVTSLAGVGAMLRSLPRLTYENAAAAPAMAVQGAVAAPGYLMHGAVGAVGAVAAALANPFQGPDPLEDAPVQDDVRGQVLPPGRAASGYPGARTPAEMRRARSGPEETQMAAGPTGTAALGRAGKPWRGGGELMVVGDLVEIFSNSQQVWCQGRVESLEPDGMVNVSFKINGAGPGKERGSKKLPQDHKDLRPIRGISPGSPTPAPARGQGALAKGDPVEVYSNSQQAWCQGYVEKVDGRMASLAFRLPGAGPDEWSLKQLPIGHDCVRPRLGEAQMSGDGAPSPAQARAVAELKAAKDSQDIARILDACQRAEVSGVDPSEILVARLEAVRLDAAKELQDALLSDSAADIERACKTATDAGVVAAEVEAARSRAAQLLQDMKKNAPEGQAQFQIGDWLEVYSNSNKAWCVGRVTQTKAGSVTVAFQLPGAKADDWVEKKLPIDSADLRKLAPPEAQLSGEEEALYKRLYAQLAQGEAAAADLDAVLVANHLWSSGLPRKALKQVWRLANPKSSTRLEFEGLSICLRLTGHCQAVLAGAAAAGSPGMLSAAELLSAGGEPLRQWLQERAKEPPPQMPKFSG